MMGLEIRPGGPGDARAVAEIHVRSFRATYAHLPRTSASAETGLAGRVPFWEQRLARTDARTLIAVEGDRVVGFIHFAASTDTDADETVGHIYSVHVEPDVTGRGIGGRLVEAAENSLLDDGYGLATLWVVKENESARRFYRRLGWEPDGAAHTEKLSVGDEDGDEVEVVRLRRALVGGRKGR